MVLGLNSAMIWTKPICSFNPSTLTDDKNNLIAWYDFTDQSTIFKDTGGVNQIGANENIGRINNKVVNVIALGHFLRAIASGSGVGDDGGSEAPTFKLGGGSDGNRSYAEFDSTGFSGNAQCLVGSDYYNASGTPPNFVGFGHGGGVGDMAPETSYEGHYYNGFLDNGESSPNDNYFSAAELDCDNLTVCWVIEPSATTYATTDIHTYWVIRPQDSSDSGAGRANQTHWEAKFVCSTDTIETMVNCEDQNSGSGTSYETSTGISMQSGINFLVAEFQSGTNKMKIENITAGTSDTTTITTSSTYNMKSGMMALGAWSNGNVNSSQISGSGFDGKFFEIMVWKSALTSAEKTTLSTYLNDKYSS
tara:strand:- start:44 stop:1132 length:1089 start_codon:yes stop_codon:yes gene_type:complete